MVQVKEDDKMRGLKEIKDLKEEKGRSLKGSETEERGHSQGQD